MRSLAGVILCCVLVACSGDDDGPGQDTGTTADLPPGVDGQSPADGAGKTDGPTAADGPATADGPAGAWSCTLKPGGGSFTTPHADGCKWEWACPTEGDRQLYCETVSTASHDCSCKNVTAGTTEKTFASIDICTHDSQAIAAEANKHCGWKLP